MIGEETMNNKFTEDFPSIAIDGVGVRGELDGILGIPSDPFSHQVTGNTTTSNNIPFDLEAISTSGRDVTFETIPSTIIDPSALVKSTDAFMEPTSMLDIDSLMNT